MKKYKVFFHRGDELTIKTRVTQGHAWIDDAGLHVASNSETLLVPGRDVSSVELFRLHGLGRVVRVHHRKGAVVHIRHTVDDRAVCDHQLPANRHAAQATGGFIRKANVIPFASAEIFCSVAPPTLPARPSFPA